MKIQNIKGAVLIVIALVLISYSSYSQENSDVGQNLKRNVVGINIGIAALEALLDESGLQVEFYYHHKLNKVFFVGVEQGFVIQDNFPANFYPSQVAPFQLPPEIDSYIRNLSFAEIFDFGWQKTTMIYLIPVVGAELVHYKRFSLSASAGVGITYRNYTRFGLASATTSGSDMKVVDYKEILLTNSVIAPILNVSFVLSQKLTPTLAMQLNFKYNHELSNFEDPKNAGSSDYMALRLGLSKTF